MIHVKGTGGGVNIKDATAMVEDVLLGKTFYAGADKGKKTGTIPVKAAATITPGTAAQTIAAGQYLSGGQTIQGDANLLAENIKSGVSIFGVAGSFSGYKVATGSVGTEIEMRGNIVVTGLDFKPYAIGLEKNLSYDTLTYVYDLSDQLIYVHYRSSSMMTISPSNAPDVVTRVQGGFTLRNRYSSDDSTIGTYRNSTWFAIGV